VVWHTTPDKWAESRIYESPFNPEYSDRLTITHEKLQQQFTMQVLSPNKAYWFAATPDWPKLPVASCNGAEFTIQAEDAPIFVFTEKEYLLKINLRHHYPNFAVTVRWINERLLFLQVWWGRILGSCYLLDTESECVIYKEMLHDGGIEYEQWQQDKKK